MIIQVNNSGLEARGRNRSDIIKEERGIGILERKYRQLITLDDGWR